MIVQTSDPFVIFSFHHGISLVFRIQTLQLCISSVLPEGRPRDNRMTNFDNIPLYRLSEQIIHVLTTTDSTSTVVISILKKKTPQKIRIVSFLAVYVYVYHVV